jgi:hypothetical protein
MISGDKIYSIVSLHPHYVAAAAEPVTRATGGAEGRMPLARQNTSIGAGFLLSNVLVYAVALIREGSDSILASF